VVKTDTEGEPLLIRTTVFHARDRRAYEQELLHAREAAERDQARLRRLVGELQRRLLPATLVSPPDMQTVAYYHMTSEDEVVGDFYDLFALADDRRGFCLGDVCGKGVDAAAVLSNLNTVIYHDPDAGSRYCTVNYGTITLVEGGYSLTLARGGHPPPILLRANGTADHLPLIYGPLVGVLPEASFATHTIMLYPGDTLLLHRDGLTDAYTGTGRDRFGDDRLLAFVAGLAQHSPAAVVEAVTELLSGFGHGMNDDVAVMAIGVAPTPDE
jgi:sigma-B regulation protein RsbU (phosphoserine phosphatase)